LIIKLNIYKGLLSINILIVGNVSTRRSSMPPKAPPKAGSPITSQLALAATGGRPAQTQLPLQPAATAINATDRDGNNTRLQAIFKEMNRDLFEQIISTCTSNGLDTNKLLDFLEANASRKTGDYLKVTAGLNRLALDETIYPTPKKPGEVAVDLLSKHGLRAITVHTTTPAWKAYLLIEGFANILNLRPMECVDALHCFNELPTPERMKAQQELAGQLALNPDLADAWQAQKEADIRQQIRKEFEQQQTNVLPTPTQAENNNNNSDSSKKALTAQDIIQWKWTTKVVKVDIAGLQREMILAVHRPPPVPLR